MKITKWPIGKFVSQCCSAVVGYANNEKAEIVCTSCKKSCSALAVENTEHNTRWEYKRTMFWGEAQEALQEGWRLLTVQAEVVIYDRHKKELWTQEQVYDGKYSLLDMGDHFIIEKDQPVYYLERENPKWVKNYPANRGGWPKNGIPYTSKVYSD